MSGPKYPNQQLRSVSLETFFPGALRALSAFGEIQTAVRANLPDLFVPYVQSGEHLALRPFQLRNAEQSKMLALALNQVTYASFQYPGYDIFSAEAIPVVSSALATLATQQLNKVVYRYENEVGLARDVNGDLGIERICEGIVPKMLADSPSKAINAAFEHSWQADGLKGDRGFHARAEDANGLTVFRITVFGTVEKCQVKDLGNAVAAAHKIAVEVFESLISPSFRDFISSGQEEQR